VNARCFHALEQLALQALTVGRIASFSGGKCLICGNLHTLHLREASSH